MIEMDYFGFYFKIIWILEDPTLQIHLTFVYTLWAVSVLLVVLFWIRVRAQANRICWVNCRGEASRAILEVWGRVAGRVALTLAWEGGRL